MSNERTHRVAVIGGDGIGPEVTRRRAGGRSRGRRHRRDDVLRTGRRAVPAATVSSSMTRRWRNCAVTTPSCSAPSVRRSATRGSPGACSSADCCCGCASGSTSTSTTDRFAGVAGSIAEGCEFAIVRENTEGPYAGEGGILRRGTPHGDRDPGFGQHPLRRRALRALRLRTRCGARRHPS